MGQIVSLAAKPKRCNLNKLSQLGTPAAGEHILVSSDNSMNAAGQGNFDCFVVGDGTKAANLLEVKRIQNTLLFTKITKEDILAENGYVQVANGQPLTSSTTFSHSDYIPVKEGDHVIYTGFSGNTAVSAIYGYAADKSIVGSILAGNGTKRTYIEAVIPSGVAYIRISAGNSTHANYMDSTSAYIYEDISLDRFIEVEDAAFKNENSIVYINEEVQQIIAQISERPVIPYPLPDNAVINSNSVITSDQSNPWYVFRSTAEYDNVMDAWEITVNDKSFAGLRSATMWSLLNGIEQIDFTKDIFISIDVFVDADGLAIYEMNIDTPTLSTLFYKSLDKGWNNNILLTIPANTYSSINDTTRMHFWVEAAGDYGQSFTGIYYIRNFGFSQERKWNTLREKVDEVEKETNALKPIVAERPFTQYPLMPIDMQLVKDSVVTTDSSKNWYAFHSSAIWNNSIGAWEVRNPNSALYNSLRSAINWSSLNSIKEIDFAKDIYLIFDVYAEEDGLSLYELNGDNVTPSSVLSSPLKKGWNKSAFITIPANKYSSVSELTRMQIWVTSSANYGDVYNGKYYVKNFGFSQEFLDNNLTYRVEQLEASSKESFFEGKKVAIIGDSISTSARFSNYHTEILSSDVGNSLEVFITYFDLYEQDTTTPRSQTIGGVSLTDSMIGTKQTFTPVLADVGKRFGVNYVYNSSASLKTWGELVANNLEMEVIGNSQWSGASMCSGQTGLYVGTSGWSDYTIAACSTRDSEGNAVNPDVILIYRGVNDLSHGQGGHGYSRIDAYDMMANGYPQNDFDGTYYQFRRAYYMSIEKLRTAYPNALIFCCTLNVFKRVTYDRFPTRNGVYSLPQLNAVIRDIANEMGCGLIELDKDGITFENCYPTYISDSATTPTHPNQNGHKQMARKAVADMIGYIKQVSE